MRFAPLLALASLVASVVAVNVTSADGTNIWAESTGDPSKPAVVFIPGFSCTSLAFDKQWANPSLKSSLFMVRNKIKTRNTRLRSLPSFDRLCFFFFFNSAT